MVAYVLDCGHIQSVQTAEDLLLIESRAASSTVYCKSCDGSSEVVEQVDPADHNINASGGAAS